MKNSVKQQIQALAGLEPEGWVFVMGCFDRERWRKSWQEVFDSHDLIHNRSE